MTLNKRFVGSVYEKLCVSFLEKNGISVLELNYRNRTGEVDIIGKDQNYLIFFEVKFRSSNYQGLAECAVNFNKQKNICRLSDYYRMKKGYNFDTAIRYDVLAINGTDISWYKNAFEYV